MFARSSSSLAVRGLATVADTASGSGNGDSVPLFRQPVEFRNWQGRSIKTDAVYSDTMPGGSSIGTLIGLHGCPGSHSDWKYVGPLLKDKGIRTIGLNFPGYGYTDEPSGMSARNECRDGFVSSFTHSLSLPGQQLAFIGHSRGSENALHAAVNHDALGLIMINSPGLRIHRGIRPMGLLKFLNRLHEKPLTRGLVETLLFHYYTRMIRFRQRNGYVAALCVHTMETTTLGGQREWVDRLRDRQTRFLLSYGGADPIIETEIPREMAQILPEPKLIHVAPDSSPACVSAATAATGAAFEGGARSVAVEFSKNDHFLQKHRADFLADAIASMFHAGPKRSEE